MEAFLVGGFNPLQKKRGPVKLDHVFPSMGRKGPKIFEKHQQDGGLYLLLRPFFFRWRKFKPVVLKKSLMLKLHVSLRYTLCRNCWHQGLIEK